MIFAKYVHLYLFYVLEYSGSFDMQIEKLKKKKKNSIVANKVVSFHSIVNLANVNTAAPLLSIDGQPLMSSFPPLINHYGGGDKPVSAD